MCVGDAAFETRFPVTNRAKTSQGAIEMTDNENPQPTVDFDPDALRARYQAERDKRIRENGADQYLEMAGEYARFAEEDTYADPNFDREPINDEIDIAIIGGGFSGLLAAARLTDQGVTSFRIIEAGADFGGTWYWNRYPGAQCDTEAYCYLPLLEELGYMPKREVRLRERDLRALPADRAAL